MAMVVVQRKPVEACSLFVMVCDDPSCLDCASALSRRVRDMADFAFVVEAAKWGEARDCVLRAAAALSQGRKIAA